MLREENSKVDRLSKLNAKSQPIIAAAEARVRRRFTSLGLPGEVATYNRTKLYSPRFENIWIRVMEMRAARESGGIRVPEWPGAVWTTTLKRAATASAQLGTAREIYESYNMTHNASIWAYVIAGNRK